MARTIGKEGIGWCKCGGHVRLGQSSITTSTDVEFSMSHKATGLVQPNQQWVSFFFLIEGFFLVVYSALHHGLGVSNTMRGGTDPSLPHLLFFFFFPFLSHFGEALGKRDSDISKQARKQAKARSTN